MYEILDGPSVQGSTSVTTSTPVEVKVGSSPFEGRKVVVIQPTDQHIYLYFGNGTGAPSATTIQNNGITLYKKGLYTFESTDQQDLWILSKSSTANVIIIERA